MELVHISTIQNKVCA